LDKNYIRKKKLNTELGRKCNMQTNWKYT